MRLLISILFLISCDLFTGADLMEESVELRNVITEDKKPSLEIMAGIIVRGKSVLNVHWNTAAKNIYMTIHTDEDYKLTEWEEKEKHNNTVSYVWKAESYWVKDIFINEPYMGQYNRVKEIIFEEVTIFAKKHKNEKLLNIIKGE